MDLKATHHRTPSAYLPATRYPLKSLVATIELLDEGATVPFIARYRKEATGNLDEVQIRAIEEKLALLPRTRRTPRDSSAYHRGAGQTHAGT